MRSSSSDKKVRKDWHYYLTNEAFMESWKANKTLYVSFFVIGLVLLLSIAYLNRHIGG